MPSMTYCQIENTAPEVEEIVERVREKLDRGERLSRSEYRALTKLVDHAKELVQLDKDHDFDDLNPNRPV